MSVDDKGKTEHAVFVDGIRSGEWADGAPSRTVSPSSTPNEPVQSAERAETASSPEEKTEMSPVPKKVDRATAPSKAAEKRSEKPIEEAAFTPPPDKIELPASAPKTDYDRVIERGNARKAAASPSPTVVEQAKPSLTVEVAATKTTPTPSATNTPPPEQHAASTPAATAAPTARSNYSRRPPGRGASDPSDALRSLSLPPSGLRRAAELNGLTSPSSPAPTSSPTPSVTEPAKGQPSPTPNP